MTTYEQPKDWIERHLVEDPGGLLACEPSGLNEELRLARQANEAQHQQLAALNEHQIAYEAQMEQQLANATKQNVLLRDAIEEGLSTYHVPRTARIMEALAATDNLSGLVLCDAEPVAWMFDGLTGTYFGKKDKLPRPEAIQLFRRKKP